MDSDDSDVPVPKVKRRRLQNSCDNCRRRKIRCDSAEQPGNRCTNCKQAYLECINSRPKKGEKEPSPSSTPGAESVKTPQEHVATILSTTTVYVPSHDTNVNHEILVQVAHYARDLEEEVADLRAQLTQLSVGESSLLQTSDFTPSPASSASSPASGVSGSGDIDEQPLIRAFSRGMILSGSERPDRFYGLSSGVQFIKAAMSHLHGDPSHVAGVQRPEFWTMRTWDKYTLPAPRLIFPPDDLLDALIKIYFARVNPLFGVLHYPSFQQSIVDGLHLRNREFGALVLVVCALGSRSSDDPRVFVEGSESEHSAGWKWYSQVRPLRAPVTLGTSLPQLQLICLSVIFVAGMTIPEDGWLLAGLGVRMAQCAGAHHRGGYQKLDPLSSELYRRVFWILFAEDTIMSSFNGRPAIVKPTDYDVPLPTDLDEESWGIPNAVQPEGKLSQAVYLPVYLKLILIVQRIQRAVYPVNGQLNLQDVIVDLDSELNKWVDDIPEHLKWNPHQENQIFLDQSAALYATYYHAQILIHRALIPAPGKEPILSFPSLAICANAARSCGHVLDVQARRGRGLLHFPSIMTALFDSAAALLIHVWALLGGRKSRTEDDFTRATADAQNCMRVLRLYEKRWRSAGRDCDIIMAMLNIGRQSLKRRREAELEQAKNRVEIADESFERSMSVPTPQQQKLPSLSLDSDSQLFALPLLTEELGRLPIYDSFNYEPTLQGKELSYSSPDLLDPEVLFGAELALDSMFASHVQPQVSDMRSSTNTGMQIDTTPFDIPAGNTNWEAWTAYLAGLDNMDQRTS
ncbi:fungal-trans domain-containing protein [Favolaschia claudopus]|uniref:Fungal-trans domain-containing protein n=1 Tax=Favolaschia claudopus TaxID=2862362 RepID=A0AAW0EFW3_9AGAR